MLVEEMTKRKLTYLTAANAREVVAHYGHIVQPCAEQRRAQRRHDQATR